MKVKIGDKIHNAEDEPILLMLNESDKSNILMMFSNNNLRYCAAPGYYTKEQIKEFMETDKNVKSIG